MSGSSLRGQRGASVGSGPSAGRSGTGGNGGGVAIRGGSGLGVAAGVTGGWGVRVAVGLWPLSFTGVDDGGTVGTAGAGAPPERTGGPNGGLTGTEVDGGRARPRTCSSVSLPGAVGDGVGDVAPARASTVGSMTTVAYAVAVDSACTVEVAVAGFAGTAPAIVPW